MLRFFCNTYAIIWQRLISSPGLESTWTALSQLCKDIRSYLFLHQVATLQLLQTFPSPVVTNFSFWFVFGTSFVRCFQLVPLQNQFFVHQNIYQNGVWTLVYSCTLLANSLVSYFASILTYSKIIILKMSQPRNKWSYSFQEKCCFFRIEEFFHFCSENHNLSMWNL
jgi:hypothetical protein